MAIFKKNEQPQPQKPKERSAPPPRGASGDAAISIIGQGMSVVGDISTEGIVRVEGEVRGTVRAGKAVILGHGGMVDGNVLTEDAVIGGTVSGAIIATSRLELQSTCTVRGEIRTRAEHLKLEEGARFAGQVQILEEQTEPESAAPSGATASGGSKPSDSGSARGAASKPASSSPRPAETPAAKPAEPSAASSEGAAKPDSAEPQQPAEASAEAK